MYNNILFNSLIRASSKEYYFNQNYKKKTGDYNKEGTCNMVPIFF